MIDNYIKFLESVDEDLQKIFEFQKEYIFCKEGCSHCCKRGNFPMSALEMKYLMIGYQNLSADIKKQIDNNIEKLKNGNKDSYICPFLINEKCSVYKNRPLVCRAFGVLTEDAHGNPSFPFCTTIGLNFSQIYDEKEKHLSSKLYKEGNFKNYPKIFRLSNNIMMNLPLAKELKLEFGQLKRMIDFFEN